VLPLLHLVVMVLLLPPPFLVLVLLLMPLVLVHLLLLLFLIVLLPLLLLPLFLCSLLCNKEQHDVRPHTPYKQHDSKYLQPPKTKCSCSSADKSKFRSARYILLRGERVCIW
jgi:hypothetical protein